jgi:23S rRNA pseudouridine955/2504/2580 synthase
MKKINFEDIILFENEDYLVINKPPYLSTLDDRVATGKQNVLMLAKQYCPDVQMGHRLDKETSGVLAMAKNSEAYRHLSIQFERRKTQKFYHAIVTGIHDFQGVEVNKPIYAFNTGVVKIDYENGKQAKTIVNTLEVFQKNTLLECKPITGRMHQIRIHLATLGATIVNDEQYGGKPIFLSELKTKKFNLKKDTEEQPLISRVALHAKKLIFNGLDEKEIIVEADYPKDIKALLTQLRKFA